jgi:hypothetical protein
MTRSNSFFDHTGGPQIVERLLKGVSDAKVAGMLVRAWVEEKFGADSKEYAQVNGLLKKQENYNRDSTEYFQAVEDELTGNSVIGIRTYGIWKWFTPNGSSSRRTWLNGYG